MRRVALYCNVFWLFFSLLTCIESCRLKLGDVTKPGPGFFPFGAGLIMLVLSLIALFQWMGKKDSSEITVQKKPVRWWNIVIILAATLAYALSLEKIGFLINTFLLITLLLKVVEPQTWKTSILGGVITAIAANLVFNVLFQAQIPSGILGF
jgi:putative tricarboxylic transport membrane protein